MLVILSLGMDENVPEHQSGAHPSRGSAALLYAGDDSGLFAGLVRFAGCDSLLGGGVIARLLLFRSRVLEPVRFIDQLLSQARLGRGLRRSRCSGGGRRFGSRLLAWSLLRRSNAPGVGLAALFDRLSD